MNAATRVMALAHVTVCANCAARLHDAREIGSGLKLAAEAETEETPARVRQALLAAFAEHHQQIMAPVFPQPLSRDKSRRALRWWSAAAAVAAAAVVILALMLLTLRGPSAPKPIAGVSTPSPQPKDPTPIPNSAKLITAAPLGEHSPVAKNVFRIKRSAVARNTRVNNGNQTVASTGNVMNTSNQYVPLTYLASSTAMESGTVVRVQLSRSALLSLGLPLNADRAGELIKADLVLGDDGVARAIRLVQ